VPEPDRTQERKARKIERDAIRNKKTMSTKTTEAIEKRAQEIKEAHLRAALRDIEIEEEYSARTEAFIEQLRSISDQMEETADRLEEK